MKKFWLGLVCGIAIATSTAVYANEAIQATLFPVQYFFNSQPQEPDSEYATLNYNGHAYVPVRFVAESMGATVNYDEADRYISIRQPLVVPYRTPSELDTFSIEGYITKIDGERVLIVSTSAKEIHARNKEFYEAVWVGNVPKGLRVGQRVQVSFQGVVETSYPAQSLSDKLSFMPVQKPKQADLSEEQVVRQAILQADKTEERLLFVVKDVAYDESSDTWSVRYVDAFQRYPREEQIQLVADQ